MRFEIVLFFIVTGLLFHIYTDGKYLKMIVVYKKYTQMAGVLVGAFFIVYFGKKESAKCAKYHHGIK